MPSTELTPRGIAYAHQAASKSYDDQMRWIDALDTKAGILMAADGAIVSLVVTGDSVLLIAPKLIQIAAPGLLFISLVFALLAFSTRRYEIAPDLEPLVRQMQHLDDDGLRWIALEGLVNAVEVNESKMNAKAEHLFFSAVALLMAILVLAGFFIYSLI